jgi:phosphopantetheinyl transferase
MPRDLTSVVHWRFARDGVALPPSDAASSWLAPEEAARAEAFRVEKRRRDWVLGRLNLKALLVDVIAERYGHQLSPGQVVIARQPSGAPAVKILERVPGVTVEPPSRLPLSVSNSHSHGHALAGAVWTDVEEARGLLVAVGVDLEWIEPRSEGFVRDFLTAEEQKICADATGADRSLWPNLAWSAKESVLKVLQRGLTADTWWLTCLPSDDDGHAVRLSPETPRWSAFRVQCDPRLGADAVEFTGRWCECEGFVLTLALGSMELQRMLERA